MSAPAIPADAGRSWWLHDALALDAGEPAPSLDRDTAADVVILGGGYTGMWTAWFLKERSRTWTSSCSSRTSVGAARAGATADSSTAGGARSAS